MVKILMGEWLAIAIDKEGFLWTGQVMGEVMLYDPYWAPFTSYGSQEDCVTESMLVFDGLMRKCTIEMEAWIAGLKVPRLRVVNSLPVES